MSDIYSIILFIINVSAISDTTSKISQLPINPDCHTQEIYGLRSNYKKSAEEILDTNALRLKLRGLLNRTYMLQEKLKTQQSDLNQSGSLFYRTILWSIYWAYMQEKWEKTNNFLFKTDKYFTITTTCLAGLATAYKAYCNISISEQIALLEELISEINIKLAELE